MQPPAWAAGRRGALALLLLAALAFDVLRALTVPAGLWNIDEAYHFVDLQNAARLIPYEARRLLGADEPPPPLLAGGTLPDPLQLFHPPGWLPVRGATYYVLQGLLQLPLQAAPESARLLAARLFSALLHLLIIALTYGTLRALLPGGSAPWLPLAAATLAAFLPSYSDMLSAVNLDAGIAAAGALYMWALARLLREGWRWRLAGLLLLAAVLGVGAKETFWPLVPATGAALAWLRLGRRARALAALGAAALLAGAFVWLQPFTTGGAAYWFDADWEFGHDATLAPRAQTAAPVGRWALRVDGEMSEGVWQFFPEARLGLLRGQTVTWGAWLRAAPPAEVTLGLHDGSDWLAARTVQAGPDWAFYGGSAALPAGLSHLAVRLGSTTDGGYVEYDGAVLALGEYPAAAPPVFSGSGAARGVWGGQPFANLLLNASGETAWPQVKEQYNVRPRNLNTRLNALLAWRRTLPAFAGLARWLLANFWSGFGGLLPGLSAAQLIPLALVSLWSAGGLALVALRDLPRGTGLGRARAARLGLWVLGAAALAAWFAVLYRSDFVPSTANVIVWAVTRHASAGLSATAALLAVGLLRWVPPRAQPWVAAALLLGLFLLNTWILLGVQIPYYNCPSGPPTNCPPTVH